MDEKSRSILAQVAYKCASWIHAAEVQTGATPDPDYLHSMARNIANGIVKLGGPSSETGGTSPSAGGRSGKSDSPAPSCPRCNEPMEFNEKWTGLGNVEGHKKSESIKWRCSQRGRYIKDKGWSGCDGVKWADRQEGRGAA